MVYFISHKDEEIYSYGTEVLDGDMKQVGAIDQTRDEGVRIRPWSKYAGRAVDGTHLPTKIKLDGPKRLITDVYEAQGFFVDKKFKEVVENLEPNVHQFFPVEFVWKDGSHAANRYWFIPCNRLDSVDREHTTFEFKNIWFLNGDKTKKLVFSREKIGEHHVWIDKFISGSTPLISEALKAELENAGVTGANYQHFSEVD